VVKSLKIWWQLLIATAHKNVELVFVLVLCARDSPVVYATTWRRTWRRTGLGGPLIELTDAMRRVCRENRIKANPAALRALIRELRSEGKTNIDITIVFRVSIKTLRGWFKKLAI